MASAARIRELAQESTQGGDLLVELLLKTLADPLLAHGIIAVRRSGADGIIVPLDGLCIVASHEVAITDAQHGIAALAGLSSLARHETAERGGCLIVLLQLEEGVAHTVASLLVEVGGVGSG